MSAFMHPSLILMLGALFLPLARGPLRKIYLLIPPLCALGAVLANMGLSGEFLHWSFLDWPLVFARVDALTNVFALIMAIVTVLGSIYSLHIERVAEHAAAWCYAAAALGVIYCADYLSLFFFWELMAFSSVLLIWFGKRPNSLEAGYRYLLIHAIGGVILLAGIVLHWSSTGDLRVELLHIDQPRLADWLIMLGFALNAAVTPLHSWLPDAYPEASHNGAVFLCAITTKTAVYTLARTCAGMDILLPLGVIMTLYGMFYALRENDIRRVLAWSIVSQVGYMVAAVGIGTDLAVNGAVAHAVAHIVYKSLLFMVAGAVLHMTGETKLSNLGGLVTRMPITCLFMLIGALSIVGAPFFAAYASKAMIISAAFEAHHSWAAWLLMLGAVGTILYNGLRLPYFLFFGPNRASAETFNHAADPGRNMLVAMTLGATLCVVVGSLPGALYALLPHPNEYTPFTTYHLLETLQLLGCTTLVFFLCKNWLSPRDQINLDIDWFYRQAGQAFLWLVKGPLQALDVLWGQAHSVLGLQGMMLMGHLWSWFDRRIIDGLVDGLAYSIRALGGRIRLLHSGRIQLSLFYLLLPLSLFVITFVAFRLL